MILRILTPAIILLLAPGIVLAANSVSDDDFLPHASSSITLYGQGDGQGSNDAGIDGSIALDEWGEVLLGYRRTRLSVEDEIKMSDSAHAGYSTDPLDNFVLSFDLSVSRDMDSTYKDTATAVRAELYPPQQTWLGLMIEGASNKIELKNTPNNTYPSNPASFQSRTLGGEISFYINNLTVAVFTRQTNFPENYSELSRDAAALVIPLDALDYATGLDRRNDGLSASWSFRQFKKLKPNVGIRYSLHHLVSDNTKTESLTPSFQCRLTQDVSGSLRWTRSRTKSSDDSTIDTSAISNSLEASLTFDL